MNKEQKAEVVEKLTGELKDADAIFAIDYRGMSVPQAAELRSGLREADASLPGRQEPPDAACRRGRRHRGPQGAPRAARPP